MMWVEAIWNPKKSRVLDRTSFLSSVISWDDLDASGLSLS